MGKKVVLGVLLSVCAWLWWPEPDPVKTPAQQAQERSRACRDEAYRWCHSFWCARTDYGRDMISYRACLATCETTYKNRCARFPSLLR